MTRHNAVFLLLLPVVLATPPRNFIDCPCTFSITRPLTNNIPFTVFIHSANQPHPVITRRNLTNLHADVVQNTAEFRIHVPGNSRHALSISPFQESVNVQHVSHTVCPVLLKPDPPGIFRQADQRVVGGTSASRDLRSYLAYIYKPISRRACTATVISARWLISAAHCNVTQQDLAYLQGGVSRQGTPYPIRQVIPHSNFGFNTNAPFDISVIELAVPSDATPMQINVNRDIPLATSAARVIGYGSVAFDAPTESVILGELRQVDVPVNTNAECVAAYDIVDERFQVCAGYLGRGGCDSCQGDSGGPLIQYTEDEQPVLVGVVSRGRRCGEARYPGIYVRVGAFEDWLDSVVGEPFVKARTTRAVLAVTNSSKSTFRRVFIPIAGVCAGILAVGLLIVFAVRHRRRKREREKELDEETGSTENTDGIKTWRGVNGPSDGNSPPHGQRTWPTAARRIDGINTDRSTPGNGRRVNGDVLSDTGMVGESDSDASFASEHTGRVGVM